MGSKLQRLDPDAESETTFPEAGRHTTTGNPLNSDGKRQYQSIVGSLMWLMLYT